MSNSHPKNTEKSARREFIKLTGLSLGGLGVLSSVLRATTGLADETKKPESKSTGAKAEDAKKPAAGSLELVDPNDALPKGLGYVHDGGQATRPDKAGTKGADQTCANCQFYTKAGELNSSEVGKCQLFPKGVVKSGGWCKSWIKKAG